MSGSFFDQIITNLENERFISAVNTQVEPKLDLLSMTDPSLKVKMTQYMKHPSYNIKNALNPALTLNWCFLRYLSALQLRPSKSAFSPPPPAAQRHRKPVRYFFRPAVIMDRNGLIVTKQTMPDEFVHENSNLNTTASRTIKSPGGEPISVYQHFVATKEKQKKIDKEIQSLEHDYNQGSSNSSMLAAQLTEYYHKIQQLQLAELKIPGVSTPAPQTSPADSAQPPPDDDDMRQSVTLNAPPVSSTGQVQAPVLSFKKIGRLLLRVAQYGNQPIHDRYHFAVNLWNEIFTIMYSYQSQIETILTKIKAFRDYHAVQKTQYSRRVAQRLQRIYLVQEHLSSEQRQLLSPATDATISRADRDKGKDVPETSQTVGGTVVTNPTAVSGGAINDNFPTKMFEGSSGSVTNSPRGTHPLYESFSVPFDKELDEKEFLAVDPTLLYLSYLLADGVLHHLFRIIQNAVREYDRLDITVKDEQRQEALAHENNIDPASTNSHSKNEAPARTKHEQDRLNRIQIIDTVWNARKAYIIKIEPFHSYYQSLESQDIAKAATHPLTTLQEEDSPASPNGSNLDSQAGQQDGEYIIFHGLQYIPCHGPPRAEVFTRPLTVIHFPPDLFDPLCRAPILYPLLEPILLGDESNAKSKDDEAEPDGSAPLKTPQSTTANPEGHEDTEEQPPPAEEIEIVPEQTEEEEVVKSPNIIITRNGDQVKIPFSTPFVKTQYHTLWVRLQHLLMKQFHLSQFLQFRALGRGAFGTVSGVQHDELHTVYAIKEISKRMIKAHDKGYDVMVINERRMLKAMHSPFVLHLHAALHDREKLYLLTDICLGGDLSFHLKHMPNRCFTYKRARFYAAQVILGLEHMHNRNVIYRDLKPSNILLDADGHAKISDLGLSLRMAKNSTKVLKHVAGTAGYWAPEILAKRGTFCTSDYWSFGVFVYEMLTGQRPKLKADIYAKHGKQLLKEKKNTKDGTGTKGLLNLIGIGKDNAPSNPGAQTPKDHDSKAVSQHQATRTGLGRRDELDEPSDDERERVSFSHSHSRSVSKSQSSKHQLGSQFNQVENHSTSARLSFGEHVEHIAINPAITEPVDGIMESHLYTKYIQRNKKQIELGNDTVTFTRFKIIPANTTYRPNPASLMIDNTLGGGIIPSPSNADSRTSETPARTPIDSRYSINASEYQALQNHREAAARPREESPPPREESSLKSSSVPKLTGNEPVFSSTTHGLPIPPTIMEGIKRRTNLYDEICTGTAPNTITMPYVLSAPPLFPAEFQVVRTLDDELVSAEDINRAIKFVENPNRWTPFDQLERFETVAKQETGVLDVEIDFNIHSHILSPQAVDFFIRIFDPNPHTRLGARGIDEIKQHPFFTEAIDGVPPIDWDLMTRQLIIPPYKPDENTVHAKTMDELNQQTIDQKYRHIKLMPEDDKVYDRWYYTDQVHRERELVRGLNYIDSIDVHLWGQKHSNSKDTGKGGCCQIL